MGTTEAARERVLDHLRDGDVDAVDAELDGLAAESVELPLWRGMRALLEGRFDECRRANEVARGRAAATDPRTRLSCGLQAFHLSVAEGRLAEADVLLRGLLADPPGNAAVMLRASWAWLLGLLGRDGAARAELSVLAADRFAGLDDGAGPESSERIAGLALLAELVAMLEQRTEAAVLYHQLLPHRGRVVVQGDGAVCHGSLARYLGLLAHALGRWDDALAHFDAAHVENRRLGAPLLVAHTCRHWSALLRSGGDDRHWDRAIDLLAEAEAIYRRLGVERLAAEASSVLARSSDVDAGASGPANLFRLEGDRWLVRYRGETVRLAPTRGLSDLACLLANPGRSIHVADLLAGPAPADASLAALGRAGQVPPWRATGSDGVAARRDLIDPEAAKEYRARLARVEDELARAVGDGDRVGAALLRAERDVLVAGLAAPSDDGSPAADPVDRARRAVATRIGLAIDAIEAHDPALGRHLRHSVRVGTFCSYEPALRTAWSV